MRSRILHSALAALPLGLLANNIQVSNVSLTGQNTTTHSWQVQFDLSWENSWRTSTAEANYDAAWVFIKYRVNNGVWRHADLGASGHVAPVGSTLTVASGSLGAWIHRSANGSGPINYTDVELQWNYDGTGVLDEDIFEVKVFALEMVFLPQGAFFLGDGTTTNIQRQFELGQTGTTFHVTSENAITLGGPGVTSLNARNNVNTGGTGSLDDFTYTATQSLPASFPKGFAAFYMMKYECTQGQYVDFLNTLTPSQATARFPNQTGNSGNTIDDTGTGGDLYVTTTPERVCNYLDALDLLAFADWAALRPMSELEYEKGCRGKLAAVPNEYAWGNTSIHNAFYTLANAGSATETVSNPSSSSGNINYSNTSITTEPLRAGIFAGSFATATRVQAGSGYFGIMEMSGSVEELAVCIGNTAGRSFTSTTGNGQLAADGNTDVATWPLTGAFWTTRGGALNNGLALNMRVSQRTDVNLAMPIPAHAGGGIRLCRQP